MSHAITLDLSALLLERIERLAKAHGWEQQAAMVHLLEHGLFVCESELAARFDASDTKALQAAIAALQDVPDDPGFSLIGRSDATG